MLKDRILLLAGAVANHIRDSVHPRLLPTGGSKFQVVGKDAANSAYAFLDIAGSFLDEGVAGSPAPSPAPSPVETGTSTRYFPNYGDPDRYFGVNMVRVPLANAPSLQAFLDASAATNGVRLDAGNYNVDIIVRTGMKIYGMPFLTSVKSITYEPGASDFIIKGVAAYDGGHNFPASSLVTKRGVISMTGGRVEAVGSTLSHLLFMRFGADFNFNNASGGYHRGLRFFCPFNQAAGYGDNTKPGMFFDGGASKQSSLNTVVSYPPLTAITCNLLIQGQDIFSVAGVAIEDPTQHADNRGNIYVRNTNRFNMLGFSGRSGGGSDGIDTGAVKNHIIASQYDNTLPFKKLKFQATALASAVWHFLFQDKPNQYHDLATGATRVTNDQDNGRLYYNGSTAAPGTAAADAIRDVVAYDLTNTYQWAYPTRRAIPDPLPNWATWRTTAPDERVAIQALLNSNLTVEFENRPYCVSGVLKLNLKQRLTSAGPNFCIVAKTDTIDIFETNFVAGGETQGGLNFCDIYTYGGLNSFHQHEAGVLLSGACFVNCNFTNAARAGFATDNTYGTDNNWWEHCNFYRCGSGVRQVGGDFTAGETPTMSYIDKGNFFRCQFIECGVGIQLATTRPDNLNALKECVIADCTNEALLWTGGHNSPIALNCVFSNNGGAIPMSAPLQYVGCHFVGKAGNNFMFKAESIVEGAMIEKGTASGSMTLFETATSNEREFPRAALLNSTSEIPLGAAVADKPRRYLAVFVNNQLPVADASYSNAVSGLWYDNNDGSVQLTDDTAGATINWVPGTPIPGSRWLRDEGTVAVGAPAPSPSPSPSPSPAPSPGSPPTLRTVTRWTDVPGVSRTLALTDIGRGLSMSASVDNFVIVPAHADVPFPLNAQIEFEWGGLGQTFVAGATSGVAINQDARFTKSLAARYCTATLTNRGPDNWRLVGQLGAVAVPPAPVPAPPPPPPPPPPAPSAPPMTVLRGDATEGSKIFVNAVAGGPAVTAVAANGNAIGVIQNAFAAKFGATGFDMRENGAIMIDGVVNLPGAFTFACWYRREGYYGNILTIGKAGLQTSMRFLNYVSGFGNTTYDEAGNETGELSRPNDAVYGLPGDPYCYMVIQRSADGTLVGAVGYPGGQVQVIATASEPRLLTGRVSMGAYESTTGEIDNVGQCCMDDIVWAPGQALFTFPFATPTAPFVIPT